MGNSKANKLFESSIPANFTKPSPGDKLQVKHDWIKLKYAELKFTTLSREEIEKEIAAAASNTTPSITISSVKETESKPVATLETNQSATTSPDVPKAKPQPSMSVSHPVRDPRITTSFHNPLFGKDIPLDDRFKKNDGMTRDFRSQSHRVIVRSKSTLS
jgi:hypothetical protein